MIAAFRSLRSRDYRILLAGQGICLISLWCQRIAMIWLIYRTTESPLLLGVAAFAAEIPFLLVAPFGGLVADRVDRRRALMAVQFVAALQAFTLTALVTIGATPYPVLVALGVVLGICQSVETPVRQSMFPDLVVEPTDLPNAVALMAFMNNAGRLIGPIIAGVLVSGVGERACFALSGMSFLIVIYAVWRIRLRTTPRRTGQSASVLRQLQTGLAYAWGQADIRNALAMLATMSFCGLPYLVVMPVFTSQVLAADARTLGLLLSCAGAGGLAGLALLAARTNAAAFPRTITLAAVIGSIGLLLSASATDFGTAAVGMVLLGYGIVVTATASNIFLQFLAEPDKRGRVLGLFSMVFFGFAPLGNIAAGVLSDHFGARATFAVLGALAALSTVAATFLWRSALLERRTR